MTLSVRGTNGNCTVPATASGVAANVTTLDGTTTSFLQIFPADVAAPNTSTNNWTAGQPPTPNKVDVKLSSTGQMKVRNDTGTVNVIIDVVGFYEPVSIPIESNGAAYGSNSVSLTMSSQPVTFLTVNATLPAAGTVVVTATATLISTTGAGRVLCSVSSSGTPATSVAVQQQVAVDVTESLSVTSGMAFSSGGLKSFALVCSVPLVTTGGSLFLNSPAITTIYTPNNLTS